MLGSLVCIPAVWLHNKRRPCNEEPGTTTGEWPLSASPSPRCCSGSPQFLLHTVSGVWQSVSKYLKTQRDLNELLTIADVVLK